MKWLMFVLIAASCASLTKYRAFGDGPGYGGHASQDLGGGNHLTSYAGNNLTSHGSVQSYAHRRAREVCGANPVQIVSAQWSPGPHAGGVKIYEITHKCGN